MRRVRDGEIQVAGRGGRAARAWCAHATLLPQFHERSSASSTAVMTSRPDGGHLPVTLHALRRHGFCQMWPGTYYPVTLPGLSGLARRRGESRSAGTGSFLQFSG